MINITNDGDKITFKGHTHPNVCAAVSSIMYTTVNMLDKYDEECLLFEDNVEEDYITITILKHDNIVDMVIRNMFDMLNDLYEDGNEDKVRIIRS